MKKELWAEKYRALSLKNFKGQEETIMKLKKFFINSESGKKAAILYGLAGSGKTTLIHAFANDLGYEILEMNASDLRDREKVQAVLENASQQKSLFSKGKILLVDEVDGISGYEDRGGLQALNELISLTQFPVFMTANDIWNKKFSELRKKSEIIQVKDVDYKVVQEILKEISKKEKLDVSEEILKAIAVKSRGDVRASINDLQSVSSMKDVLPEHIHDREREESIFQALQKVFKAAKIDFELLNTFDNVNMTIDEIFLWVEENIPYEFEGEELARAFEALSIADVFRGRIIRRQHWRFLVYEYVLLTAGIAAAKKQVRLGFTSYKRPSRILKIWLNNQRQAKKKSIAVKYARATHSSIKSSMKEFSYIKLILQKNKGIYKELKLNEEEIDYLREIK